MSPAPRNALDLVFAGAGDRTVLTRRRYRWPLLIGRVFTDPAVASAGSVTVQNAAGTIIPGDVIRQRIEVTDGGYAVVRGQGATMVNGVAGGAVSTEDTRVHVGPCSRLVLDAPPRILTADAHHRQHTRVQVEPGGRLLLVDAVVLHPDLTAENFGSYESTVEIQAPNGSVLALDAQRMNTPPRISRSPNAFGTVYVVGGDADAAPSAGLEALAPDLEALTELAGPRRVYTGVSALPNDAGWMIRIAATDGGRLKTAIGATTAIVTPTMRPGWRVRPARIDERSA